MAKQPAAPPTRKPTPVGASKAPPKSGTPKTPRKRRNVPPPDLLIPKRQQGHPLKLVAQTHKAGQPDPFLRRLVRTPRTTIREMILNRAAWVDDLAAIGLILVGTVSALALINLQPIERSSLSDYWGDFLSQLFGRFGAILFSGFLVGGGILIVLPRLGIVFDLTWRRILGTELAFAGLLATIHLLARDNEPRALARSGLGGGHVGWALGEIANRFLGSALATFLFLALTILGISMVIGIRRKHIRSGAKRLSTSLERVSMVAQAVANASRSNLPRPRLPSAVGNLRTRLSDLRRRPAQATPMPTMTPPPSPPPPLKPSITSTDEEGYRSPYIPTGTPAAPVYTPPPEERAVEQDGTIVPRPAAIAPTYGRSPASKPVAEPIAEPMTPRKLSPLPTPSLMPTAVPTDDADDTLIPPSPIPPKSTPVAPAAISRAIGKTSPRPEPLPRRIRHFTVEDFKEVKYPYTRPVGLPPLTLLNDTELSPPSEEEINGNARIIENTLLDFDLDVEVVDAKIGPTVTQYAVQPFREVTNTSGEVVTQRVRVNKIVSLASDLGLALAAKRLRIQPYVPGFSYMGIEVPNRSPSIVALRPLMETEAFARAYLKPDPDAPGGVRQAPLVVPLGRDVSGEPVIMDLALMPHLLIAGTTGSGKSVCITATIAALIMNNTPERLKLILLDPKMVELTRFNGLPHLLGPVETDHERIIGVLRWATREMDRRYKLLETEAARNIEAYNRALGAARIEEHLPYIVILVDEIGDLMLSRPEEMERTVTRLAQMARAVGMHLMVATQRPSVDIITGLIKANFPARISFSVVSNTDSRVILDAPGAETLIGRGDMLYLAPDAAVARRVQGAFLSDAEIDGLVAYWKDWAAQQQAAGAPPPEQAPWERGMTRREALSETESMLEEAISVVVRVGEASTSLIQRQLNIPYVRAAQIMDLLNQLGILGGIKEDGRTREVTLKQGTDPYRKLMAKVKKNEGAG
ncbi:MAG TPA: DNA translocase FtsK [Aggregatilineales bacterium]|nr:DNA translocase FtsK [Anaerolineales bacterium]HRE47231.1 DNA translocase FtsK [Aggregatilineales bacterium]